MLLVKTCWLDEEGTRLEYVLQRRSPSFLHQLVWLLDFGMRASFFCFRCPILAAQHHKIQLHDIWSRLHRLRTEAFGMIEYELFGVAIFCVPESEV